MQINVHLVYKGQLPGAILQTYKGKSRVEEDGSLCKLCYSDSHHVSRGQPKVDEDRYESKQVTGTVVFMNPATEVLQWWRSPLELFGKGNK